MMEICEVRDEFPDYTSPFVMEDSVNNNLDEIHRDITEHYIENNRDPMKMIIEEFPYGQDDDERKYIREYKNTVTHRDITEKYKN